MKAKKYSSILGLAFEGKAMSICLMHRSGGRLRTDKNLVAPLTLDPLNDEPELVGREIRNQLDEAGIRERNCAICLPLKWMLTLHTELPPVSGEDLDEYIALQAEKSFPFPPEDLSIQFSRIQPGEGGALATVIACSKASLARLERVLKAARLRPVLFTLGAAVLPSLTTSVALIAGEGGLDLAVVAEGGFVVIRSMDDALIPGPQGTQWDIELIAQQIRITLGRLPQSLRATIKALRIFGADETVDELGSGLRDSLTPLGLTLQSAKGDLTNQGLDRTRWSKAVGIAAACLVNQDFALDFLPPHVSRFKRIAGRLTARGAAVMITAAITVVAVIAGLLIWQSIRLGNLQTQWAAMEPKYKKLKIMQANVSKFQPWFAPSVTSLAITSQIAKAFPQEGSIWVSSLDIKNIKEDQKEIIRVTCTGKANNRTDFNTVFDALQKAPTIENLGHGPIENIRPVKFQLYFDWKGDNKNAI